MPAFTGVSHLELTVSDVDRSVTWYERVFGMRKIAENSEDDHPTDGVFAHVVNVIDPTSGLVLGLIRHRGQSDDAFSEHRVGLDHLALDVQSRSELETWVEHLDRCGVRHSGINDQPYGSVLVFRDPDNIQLELFALKQT